MLHISLHGVIPVTPFDSHWDFDVPCWSQSGGGKGRRRKVFFCFAWCFWWIMKTALFLGTSEVNDAAWCIQSLGLYLCIWKAFFCPNLNEQQRSLVHRMSLHHRLLVIDELWGMGECVCRHSLRIIDEFLVTLFQLRVTNFFVLLMIYLSSMALRFT